MKIRPAGAEFVVTDIQTDMTKLIVAFGNFGNAPKEAQPLAAFSFMWLNHFKYVER